MLGAMADAARARIKQNAEKANDEIATLRDGIGRAADFSWPSCAANCRGRGAAEARRTAGADAADARSAPRVRA